MQNVDNFIFFSDITIEDILQPAPAFPNSAVLKIGNKRYLWWAVFRGEDMKRGFLVELVWTAHELKEYKKELFVSDILLNASTPIYYGYVNVPDGVCNFNIEVTNEELKETDKEFTEKFLPANDQVLVHASGSKFDYLYG